MDTPPATPFDPYAYLDELIAEMGLDSEAPERIAALRSNMMEALGRKILQAASENIEGETVDVVMDDLKDEQDVEFIFQELMRRSPAAQEAMLEALDEFREETLEAFNRLKTDE